LGVFLVSLLDKSSTSYILPPTQPYYTFLPDLRCKEKS
jgi:hypothetical protein